MSTYAPSRTCCLSYIGFAHKRGCSWAKENCPWWLDPFICDENDSQYRHRLYMEAIRGRTVQIPILQYTGEITYCWLGAQGWPTTLRIDDKHECAVELVVCISGFEYIYPRLPTAEELYEKLRAL